MGGNGDYPFMDGDPGYGQVRTLYANPLCRRSNLVAAQIKRVKLRTLTWPDDPTEWRTPFRHGRCDGRHGFIQTSTDEMGKSDGIQNIQNQANADGRSSATTTQHNCRQCHQ